MPKHNIVANKINATAVVAASVNATELIGDGSKLTGIKIPAGTCKNGQVVTGITSNGEVTCADGVRIPIKAKVPTTCNAKNAGLRYYNSSDASIRLCDGAVWRRFPADSLCGNKVVNTDEECDDGNTVNGDGCNASCRKNVCGDGVVHKGKEQCDENNQKDGDGCSKLCKSEVFTSCSHALSVGSKQDGKYWIEPKGSAVKFHAWCDQSNGGWMLVMTLTASSAYTYDHAVWTKSDDTSGKVPLLTQDADVVSRLFYHYVAKETRLCMHRYSDKKSVVCDTFKHTAKTPRSLAAGPVMGSSYGSTGKLSAAWRSVVAGSKWGANRWQRWGWAHGKSGCYGLRVGFSADNDSSDSRDAGIGMGVGVLGNGCGVILNTGSGYFHYPGWSPQPSPLKSGLRSYIWVR